MSLMRALGAPIIALVMAVTLIPAPGATPAEAATKPAKPTCQAVVSSRVLFGVDYRRMRTKRTCVQTRDWSTAGESNLATNSIVVFADPRVPTREIAQTAMHELTHQVDWRTSRTHRKQLYRYLGYRTDGSFWSVPSPAANWDGRDLRVWLSDPHERLAESVVRCQSGSPRIEGMRLVPKKSCPSFMSVYRKAVAAAR